MLGRHMKRVLVAALYAVWLLMFFVCAPANFLLFEFPKQFPAGGYLSETMAWFDRFDPHVHWRWGAFLGSFVIFAIANRLHKQKFTRAIFFALVAGLIGSFYDFDFMREGGTAGAGLFACIAAALFFFVFACDALTSGLAEWLTRHRGELWVKEIDYIYLSLASLGIASSVFKLQKPGGATDLSMVDWFGPIVLSLALALRMVKTRAEVNEWNKMSTWERKRAGALSGGTAEHHAG